MTVPSPQDCPPETPNLLAGRWLELSERMSICARHLRAVIAEHCHNLELNEPQLSVLWACLSAPAGGLGQKDLADLLVISPAHVSGLVEQLRCAGLLCGRRSVHDRRRQQWQLTPAGVAKLHAFLGQLAQWTVGLEYAPANLLAMLANLTEFLSPDSPTAPCRLWGPQFPEPSVMQRGAA